MLQRLQECRTPVLERMRAETLEVARLSQELKYWMRKVAIMMDSQAALLGQHLEILLKYDIVASRHLGDGKMILNNMMLKEKLALYQPPTTA